MNWATYIWIGLGAIAVLVEGIALLNKKEGDTLSEHVWKWLKVEDKSKKLTAWRFFVLAFMLWLTGHFVFGWWAG
jgi:hypothetical protein